MRRDDAAPAHLTCSPRPALCRDLTIALDDAATLIQACMDGGMCDPGLDTYSSLVYLLQSGAFGYCCPCRTKVTMLKSCCFIFHQQHASPFRCIPIPL